MLDTGYWMLDEEKRDWWRLIEIDCDFKLPAQLSLFIAHFLQLPTSLNFPLNKPVNSENNFLIVSQPFDNAAKFVLIAVEFKQKFFK